MQFDARIDARSNQDVGDMAGIYNEESVKEFYKNRNKKDGVAYMEAVTKGNKLKYSEKETETISKKQLFHVCELQGKIDETKESQKDNGLMSAWYIYEMREEIVSAAEESEPEVVKPVLVQKENVLEEYGAVTLDKIKESTKLIKQYGPLWLVWACNLSQKYMAASCDKDLKERIEERYKNIPEEEKGGATYFKLAILCMTSMGYAVTRALEMKVSYLKIVDFDNGDVHKALKFFKGGHQRLWLEQPKSPNHINYMFQFL